MKLPQPEVREVRPHSMVLDSKGLPQPESLRHPTVLLAGLSGLDMVPQLPTDGNFLDKLVPGHIVPIGDMTFSTGGAVLNTGVALHRLGVGVRLLANVGDDAFGDILVDIVEGHLRQGEGDLREGDGKRPEVDGDRHEDDGKIRVAEGNRIGDSELLVLRQKGGATSYTIVISPPGMDRIFLGHVGVNARFEAGMVTEDHLDGIELFHFGYPPLLERTYVDEGKALAELFASLRRRGIVTSLDMCMPGAGSAAVEVDWRRYLERVLPHVDIFMPSLEESIFMLDVKRFREITRLASVAGAESAFGAGSGARSATGAEFSHHFTEQDLLQISQTFLNMGARIVGLKLGSAGLFVQTGDLGGVQSAETGRVPTWWKRVAGDPAWSNRQLMAPCYEVEVAGTAGSGDATISGFLAAMIRGLSLKDCMSYGLAVGACSVERPETVSGVRGWQDTSERMLSGDWGRLPSVIDGFGWRREGEVYCGPGDRVWG